MSVVEMSKYRLAVRKAVLEPVSEALQATGLCEFCDVAAERAGTLKAELESRLRRAEDLLSEARFVQRFAAAHVPPAKGGLARLLGDLPEADLEAMWKGFDTERFSAAAEGLRAIERRLAETRSDLTRIAAAKAMLAPLFAVAYPFEMFHTGTDLVFAQVGAVPAAAAEGLNAELAAATQGRAEVRVLPQIEGEPTRQMTVVALRADESGIREACDAAGFARIEIPRDWQGLPADEDARLDARAADLSKAESDLLARAAAAAPEGLAMAERVIDLQSILKDRLEAMGHGVDTEQVHILAFWAPAAAAETLKTAVAPWAASLDLAEVGPEEDEVPPTLLANPGPFAPYEPLTLMYGAPTYGTVDPTSLMAPFFFVFFGMCLGDAGYGLIITAALLAVSFRHKIRGEARKFFLILLGGSIATIVVGALTGSFMGDMIESFAFLAPIRGIKRAIQVTDPMRDPMTYLAVSLALGFFQLMFGLFIAMRACLKRGDYMGAFADKGGWILFLIGLVVFGLGKGGMLPAAAVAPGGIAAAAGALILFLTQGREKPGLFGKALSGLLSLYGVTSYLGDTLSYSRLLALGMSSAAIGMIVNLLCNLVWDVPYVGAAIAVVIFVVGQLFSVAVSILGAFIHSLRLQYVEFFSKFYEGNGRAFEPLSLNPQYVRLAPRGTGAAKD